MLTFIETHNIEKINGNAITEGKEINLESVVSMNMWGLYPEFFDILNTKFNEFLNTLDSSNLKDEYLLPTIIGNLLHDGKISVEILKSTDSWFGVTYKEDKDFVKQNIQLLVEKEIYPNQL